MIEKNTFDIITQERADPETPGMGAAEVDDRAQLSLDLHMKCKGTSQTWRDQMIEDWDFFLGAQTSQKQDETAKKRGQKTFTVDVIFQAVEQAVALLTSNRPRFSATGTEDSDTRIAQVYAVIMQYISYVNSFVQKLKQIIKDYYVGSVGWAYIWWNPFANNGKGEIAIDTIDPKRVYVTDDATEFFWKNASHMLVETYLTSEQLQSMFNMTLEEVQQFEAGARNIESSTRVSEMDSGSGNLTQSGTPIHIKLDRYSRVKEYMLVLEKDDERFEMLMDPTQITKRSQQMMCIVSRTAKATNYFVHPRNVANVAKLLSQYGEVFHEMTDETGEQTQIISGVEGQVNYPPGFAPVPNSTVYLQLITLYEAIKKGIVSVRKNLVDRIKHVSSIGTKVLFEEILPTSHYVLVPLINNFDRTIFPVGDVRRVKREQEFINSVRQLVVTHAAVTTNFKIGYPEGRYNEAKLNEIYADPQKRFIPYDAEMNSSGLQVLAPPPLPNSLYQLEQQARKNIEERLGIYALMSGNPVDAPSTYKGTVALDEYGQRRIKSKKDDIEEFLNQIGKIVVDFVQYYYTDTRVINIVSPNDKPLSITLRNDSRVDNLMGDNEYRIADINVGRFDIMIVSGSTLPSNRSALLEQYAELFKIGLLDQETVLQKTEVANVEQVMERIGIINQLKAQLAQAQQMIKKLSGDMQTADREVMHAKRERDMTTFQAKLQTEEVKAAAARMVYENTLKLLKKSTSQ
jgi:hypothetical protein